MHYAIPMPSSQKIRGFLGRGNVGQICLTTLSLLCPTKLNTYANVMPSDYFYLVVYGMTLAQYNARHMPYIYRVVEFCP